MSSSSLPARRTAQTTVDDPELRALLGPPPVLKSEDVDAYNELYDQVRRAVTPAGVIEELFVRDIVDLTWEVHRLRSLKVALLSVRRTHGLHEVLKFVGVSDKNAVVNKWYAGRAAAVRKVDRLLANAGLDRRAIDAETFACNLEEIDRFDRMITLAESRRNTALRELDRHRVAVARRLRETLAEIEDAEFEDIAPREADRTSDHVLPDQVEDDSQAGHDAGAEEDYIRTQHGDEEEPVEYAPAGGIEANDPEVLEDHRHADLDGGYR